ncbi:MAG: 16S rRNA (cytosine(1402)-N(4))-methyltransferase RsmH [Alphaproteobacteria bacterium]|nr:16S rRNA (cytosine(1402)-N(4))-methyltransferase RsmH [Alphaproteobacteria bacterium]
MGVKPRDPVRHRPVLLAEVLDALAPHDGAIYVDGTFGAGGYTTAMLEAARCTVYGIDRDPTAVAAAVPLAARFPARLHLVEGRFGDMADQLRARGVDAVDGVALDLGVSSMQLDDAERGFSFQSDGPLDMRMGCAGDSAADVVNTLSERALADLIFEYGEERAARRIARAIVAARAAAPITRTAALAAIVRGVLPPKPGEGPAIDPATRTFQAIRIHVNDELGEIDRGLAAAEAMLRPGGRLAVVAFHSLEDRRVKRFLTERALPRRRPSRHRPDTTADEAPPTFRLLARRAVRPSAAEIAANPRARSARLRAAERTAAMVRRA